MDNKQKMQDCKQEKSNGRELVMEMLLEITKEGTFSHLVIRGTWEKYDYLKVEEKAFMKRLCEGTIERQIELDYVINQFSKVPVSKMKPVIRVILRMAVYQILFMDAVPDSAACNEAVKLAEKKKFHNLKGFVNGVLRNIARNKEHITYPDINSEPILYLSVKYSVPEWIVNKWVSQYSVDETERILAALLEEHEVTIRIDENLTEKEKNDLISEIEKEGIILNQHPYLPYAYTCKNMDGVQRIPGFTQGKCTVSDVSSMLVAEIAGIKEGNRIIDVCAAPGGKTMHMATKLHGTGEVQSCDVSEGKCEYIRENANRLHLNNVKVVLADATILRENCIESADIVLADLPCSGLGVMGKKRDIKFHASEENNNQILKLQKSILSVVWQYVKKGGTLIYSTCTINKDENENMAEWFLSNFPFERESIEDFLCEELRCDSTKEGYLQLLPGEHKTDGFFMAKFKRK